MQVVSQSESSAGVAQAPALPLGFRSLPEGVLQKIISYSQDTTNVLDGLTYDAIDDVESQIDSDEEASPTHCIHFDTIPECSLRALWGYAQNPQQSFVEHLYEAIADLVVELLIGWGQIIVTDNVDVILVKSTGGPFRLELRAQAHAD